MRKRDKELPKPSTVEDIDRRLAKATHRKQWYQIIEDGRSTEIEYQVIDGLLRERWLLTGGD